MFFVNWAFRSWHRFLMPFWYQLASILPPKIHPNRSKNRPQEASKNWSIFASILVWFLLHFGSQVGPFGGHVGLQKSAWDAPKVAQDALKRQKAPKRRSDSQNDPKMTLQTFQNDPPGPPKWPSRPPKNESMRCQISFSLTRGGGNAACRAEDKYDFFLISV